MSSSIGNSTAAFTIGLNVFNSYFNELHKLGAFSLNTEINMGDPFGLTNFEIELNPAPHLEIDLNKNGEYYTRLSLNGTISPFIGEFNVNLLVGFSLETNGKNYLSSIALTYQGVDGTPSEPLTSLQVDQIIRSTGIAEKLNVRINSLIPIVLRELEKELFQNKIRTRSSRFPPRKAWNIKLELRKARNSRKADAIAIFIAAPLKFDEDPIQPMTTVNTSPINAPSLLPADMAFGVILGDTGINRIFRKQADERIGKKINGAKIKELDMRLDVNRILVKGKAEKTGVKISWQGPINAKLERGTEEWKVDTSRVQTDIDRAWWVTFLEFGGIGLLSIPFMIYVENKISGGPGKVRSSFSKILQNSLAELVKAFSVEIKNSELQVESTISEGFILNNALNTFANINIKSTIPNVREMWFSNIGLTFDFTQLTLKENKFSWTVRERPMSGEGNVAGTWITAKWSDFGEPFNSNGIVKVDSKGRATKIILNNGLVLSREPLQFDPKVIVIVPDVREVWESNVGLVFDFTQESNNGNTFTWTVRQRSMPGVGTINGNQAQISWDDFGQRFDTTGVIDIDSNGRATQITLNNGVILKRPNGTTKFPIDSQPNHDTN